MDAVINIDELPFANDFCDVLVINIASESQLRQLKGLVAYAQVLVVAGSSILVIGRDVELNTSLNRNVGISGCVASADLRSFLQT